MRAAKIKTILFALSITILSSSLIINPQACLSASTRGLDMWWTIVFPSLLPFFIMSELLISFGVVHFIGVLVEPIMRPIFRVPGIGGFVWIMGMASGFPSGAKLSAKLRQDHQLTRIEAERLVAFTNSSNPLFIFGAISIGFFHNANVGIVLAVSHYISNFLVGIIMRFHGHKEETIPQKKSFFSLKSAFHLLHKKRLEETRPIGKLIGDAVSSSIQSLLMIGGFIILFSVLNKMLAILGIATFLAHVLSYPLHVLNLPTSLGFPIISGIFEITLGSNMTSGITDATLLQQVIATSFILGFGGFSVQAQIASILSETDIRFTPYFVARLLQSSIASFLTYFLWDYLYHAPTNAELPTFALQQPSYPLWNNLTNYGSLITILFLYLYLFLLFKKILSLKKQTPR